MVRQIPNLITSLNLLCGSVAVILAVSGDLISASFFILFGIFFDFFDGLAARLLDAQTPVGLQLDSLADVITSGLAPALIMVQMLSVSTSGELLSLAHFGQEPPLPPVSIDFLPFVGLLIVVASAYRLAKFNVDTRQTTGFIGLPTPANALLILSLPLMLSYQHSDVLEGIIMNKWVLLGLVAISCILLNMNVRLFGLKFKTWDFRSNAVRYIFLLVSIGLLAVLHFKGIPLVILLYLVLSLVMRERESVPAAD